MIEVNVIECNYWWGKSYQIITKDGKAVVDLQFNNEYDDGFISCLTVSEDIRRKGVGTELVKFVEQLTKDKGRDYAGLYVDKDRPEMLDWYVRMGYKVQEDYDDEHYYYMRKKL